MTMRNFILRHLHAAETERQLHLSEVAVGDENRRRREAEADADLHRTHVRYLQQRIKRLEQQLDQAMWGDETDR